MKVKTIDINALEWFDKVNGNSYFAGCVTVNYGMKSEFSVNMPLQYGYGESYVQEATNVLITLGILKLGKNAPLWSYCKDNNIILRQSIRRGCLKRELKKFDAQN